MTVGQVGHLHDAKGKREAHGDQGVHTAGRDGVGYGLYEKLTSHPFSSNPDKKLRSSHEKSFAGTALAPSPQQVYFL